MKKSRFSNEQIGGSAAESLAGRRMADRRMHG